MRKHYPLIILLLIFLGVIVLAKQVFTKGLFAEEILTAFIHACVVLFSGGLTVSLIAFHRGYFPVLSSESPRAELYLGKRARINAVLMASLLLPLLLFSIKASGGVSGWIIAELFLGVVLGLKKYQSDKKEIASMNPKIFR